MSVINRQFRKKLTEAEKDHIRELAQKARDAGDEEKEHELLSQIPIVPVFAKHLKEIFGIKELQEMGLNLSEAVEAYGEEWLNEKK